MRITIQTCAAAVAYNWLLLQTAAEQINVAARVISSQNALQRCRRNQIYSANNNIYHANGYDVDFSCVVILFVFKFIYRPMYLFI
jgi:hypothetical protein